MSRRKKKYNVPTYRTKGAFIINGKSFNDRYVPVYASMIFSEAYLALTPRQRTLLLSMLMETFMQSNKPFVEFLREHPQATAEDSGLQTDDIYFPADRAAAYYAGYKNRNSFTDDRQALEEHGFIKTISNGKKFRQKSIYRYSNDWKKWKAAGGDKS